nr:cytosine permease [Paludibacterium purpuratum]
MRVPQSARKSMLTILSIRVAAFACISQVLIGATIGYGMTFWQAVAATFAGSIILQGVSCALGIMGMREGLPTALLTQWTGFGRYGSSMIGAVFAISMTGWFGVQNAVFAEGVVHMSDGSIPFTVAAIMTGMSTTLLVLYGMNWLAKVANIAGPLFLIAMGYAVYLVLKEENLSALMQSPPPGPPLTLGTAATIIASGFIVGCVVAPDLNRYSRSAADVVWTTVVGTLIGELGVNLVVVLMIHATGNADIMATIFKTTGLTGGLIVMLATVKVNNVNIYSSSLGMGSLLKTLFNIHMSRGLLTLVLGTFGTFLSVAGIYDQFTDFLILLGITIPPIAGIMVVDYYVLGTSRVALDASRASGTLPTEVEKLNPHALIAWIGGALIGHFDAWGIPSLTAIVASAAIYYFSMKAMRRPAASNSASAKQ